LALYTDPRKMGMGPGFWPVAIGLTLWSIASGYWIAVSPLDYMLPSSSLHISDRGADIDFLFRFMTVIGNAIFTYVTGFVIYFVIVFRRRSDEPADSIGVQIHDAPVLEFWWSFIPTVLLVVLAVMSIRVWYLVQYGTGAPAFAVEAIGHQFKFEFRYPGLDHGVYDEMHLPQGRPVRVLVTSVDVLHSFWVPEFRLKADTVPGLVQNLNFTPQVAGTYLIECTEFCGVNHSEMQAKLIVEPQAKFNAWLETQKKPVAVVAPPDLTHGDAVAGKALFEQKCSACHKVAAFDQKLVGPGLGHVFTDKAHPNLVDGQSVSPEHVAALIQNGFDGGAAGTMPNAQQNGLSGNDIANLTAYLASLK